MEYSIPQSVKSVVGDQPYVRNAVGKSQSEVLIFPEYVLKIQRPSPETENEYAIVRWLKGRLPVPEIPVYEEVDGMAYTLMTRMRGEMLCHQCHKKNPQLLVQLAAEAMKRLWSVELTDCPRGVSPLAQRLKAARYHVEHGLVDVQDTEPTTFGRDGFSDPMELLRWLETHRPPEDLTLTHGDFCLPNILAQGDRLTGLIDLGKMGPADRWQDIAICLRSLRDNFEGKYSDGNTYPGYSPQLLLRELGVELNEAKLRYYTLLDELF